LSIGGFYAIILWKRLKRPSGLLRSRSVIEKSEVK